MKFNFKNYKITKTKVYIKKNSFFFFVDGVLRNSNHWVLVAQSLKSIYMAQWKISNKITKKTLNGSICRAIAPAITGITFLINPRVNEVSKRVLSNSFEALLFKVLALQLNHKCYKTVQLKNSDSFCYKDNKILIFQFRIADLKKKSK